MHQTRILRQSRLLRFFPFYKPKAAINESLDDIETIMDKEAAAEETRKKALASVEALRLRGLADRDTLDTITARGLLKSTKRYDPPENLEDILRQAVGEARRKEEEEAGGSVETDWRSQSLADPALKFTLCELTRTRLGRPVPNSQLHKMKTAGDLFIFYSQPVSNLTQYVEMARDERNPRNFTLVEHNPSFHPDDKDAHHGGVTAFPGTSRFETDLRHQRIYREFRARSEKTHYEEVGFDYTQEPSDAPWTSKNAMKSERIHPYGLNKTFTL